MSAPKWTPGPWSASSVLDNTHRAGGTVCVIVTGDPKALPRSEQPYGYKAGLGVTENTAEVCQASAYDRELALANARLIAQAPAMLEMVREAHCDPAEGEEPGSIVHEPACRRCAILRAVEGRTA